MIGGKKEVFLVAFKACCSEVFYLICSFLVPQQQDWLSIWACLLFIYVLIPNESSFPSLNSIGMYYNSNILNLLILIQISLGFQNKLDILQISSYSCFSLKSKIAWLYGRFLFFLTGICAIANGRRVVKHQKLQISRKFQNSLQTKIWLILISELYSKR